MDIAHLVVQILILAGLICYACETWKIRKTSQEQNEIMQKPCLVPLVRKDRSTEMILYSDTEMVLDDTAGGITLHNIGNGPAFNIEFEAPGENPKNFLPYIPNQSKERTTLSLEQLRSLLSPYQDEDEVKLSLLYDSLSRRRYESKFLIRRVVPSNLLVVRNCQFREITSPPTGREGRL